MQTRHRSPDSRRVRSSPDRPATNVTQQIIRPLFAALAIDLLDLATFGPVGLYTGLVLGAIVGFWLAPLLGFPAHRRWLSALVVGVYCTLPLTGLIPLATLASVVSRSLVRGNLRVDGAAETDPAGAIDVEYEVIADEPKSRRSQQKDHNTRMEKRGDESQHRS